MSSALPSAERMSVCITACNLSCSITADCSSATIRKDDKPCSRSPIDCDDTSLTAISNKVRPLNQDLASQVMRGPGRVQVGGLRCLITFPRNAHAYLACVIQHLLNYSNIKCISRKRAVRMTDANVNEVS